MVGGIKPHLYGVLVLAVCTWGCATGQTRFFIEDFDELGLSNTYYADFNECYYSEDSRGQIEVVAVSETEGKSGQPLTQVLHIRPFFAAVPGRTAVEESMINTTVSYLIVDSESGTSFDGAGFVTLNKNGQLNRVSGLLESSSLRPERHLGSAEDLFQSASVTGRFFAVRDRRQVVRIINEMKRLFGAMPRYVPQPVDPNLR